VATNVKVQTSFRNRTYEPTMGNGTSTGQRRYTTCGTRDVRKTAEYSNWPELAGAKLAESNGKGRSTYIGAQRGARSLERRSQQTNFRILQRIARVVAPMFDSYLRSVLLTLAPERGARSRRVCRSLQRCQHRILWMDIRSLCCWRTNIRVL